MIKITTWNVLADIWLNENDYPSDISGRTNTIINNIDLLKSDVFLLQEVQLDFYQLLCDKFNDKYHISSIMQNDINYWIDDLASGKKYQINGVIFMISKKLCNNPIFNKLNIEPGVCGYLDCPDFRIYNIHLDLSPDIRKKQIKCLLDHSESYNKPVIIGGDFNEYIIPIFSHPFNLIGYNTSYFCHKDDPDNETAIDHIYAKEIKSYLNCVLDRNIRDLESALNIYGSDHIPISVFVEFKTSI